MFLATLKLWLLSYNILTLQINPQLVFDRRAIATFLLLLKTA